jgi:hypothetical protein
MFDESVGTSPESTSSPAASPARAPAAPASARASDTPRPFCGERWPAPFASFDPDTSLWRTWQTSFTSTTERSGEKWSERWPRSGTTRRGIAYQQEPSAPRTAVTGSSPLLPTPTSHPRTHTPRQVDHGRQLANELAMLPTPSAEFTDVPDRETFLARREREKAKGRNGNGFGLTLPMALTLLPTPMARDGRADGSPNIPSANGSGTSLMKSLRLLPTPVAGDARNARQSTTPNPRDPTPTLSGVAYLWSGGNTGQQSADGKPSSAVRLSPWFVEWMIGAPPGWSDSDCPLSATEFKSRLEGSSASTSWTSSEDG